MGKCISLFNPRDRRYQTQAQNKRQPKACQTGSNSNQGDVSLQIILQPDQNLKKVVHNGQNESTEKIQGQAVYKKIVSEQQVQLSRLNNDIIQFKERPKKSEGNNEVVPSKNSNSQKQKNDQQLSAIEKRQQAPFKFEWDNSIGYATAYFIEDDSNKVTYVCSQLNRFQLVTRQPFSKQGKHIITVNILKQRPERAICFGFLTQKRIKKENSGDIGDEQSIGCWTYTSGKCEIDSDGKPLAKNYSKDKMGSAVKGTFEITLSCSKHKVKILRKSQSLEKPESVVEFELPKSFDGKKIHAFVSMIQKGDCVRTQYQYQQQQ